MTAVGVEEASALETQFPGLKYVSVAAGSPLPFPDGSFDWVFSHAVIEHIVDDAPRGHFVSELLRVARKGAMITTPNRYFWVETHTMVPFLHFAAPRLFNLLMDKGVVGAGAYSTSNLRLLSAAELVELGRQFCPAGWNQRLVRVRTAGLVSNLLLCLENPLASTV
jgi:ubiquinone/menaquinone biosynthesis C-methylase UbiE